MCTTYIANCSCGKGASFHFTNNVLPEEVVENIYCPEDSKNINFDTSSMINDNGWVIEYNMELAKFVCSKKLDVEEDEVTPEFIFDNGYATWKELYPGEQKESLADRLRLKELSKIDPKKYFAEIKDCANSRMKRLKDECWRKAQNIA